MTGFVLVRFANLYWLVTVSGFQGSGCSGFPAYPAVLPAACHRTRIGGKEIPYATASNVSTDKSNFLQPIFGSVRFRGSGNKNASRNLRKAPKRSSSADAGSVARDSSSDPYSLSTRSPVSQRRPAVRGCTLPATARLRKGRSTRYTYIPTQGFAARRSRLGRYTPARY